ncbi:MAG: hypothetical protein BMS9Abin12_1599 [Acidimicrobiia bacterium]|nr:MAG: hypothetical protein BMS9Abin12_1599 [Acidimicrobiia bacterium]
MVSCIRRIRGQGRSRANVPSVPVEAGIRIEWFEEPGEYPDGSSDSLRRPTVTLENPQVGDIQEAARGIRLAPSLLDLGLLEAIPLADIIANADPDDIDGDHISGVASVVFTAGGATLGRFGLKANVASVKDDAGEDLSDGRGDGTAGPSEWRTAPLWGIGLVRSVDPDAGFLHDGRARSIEEAILWHGGEAVHTRVAFMKLNASDRKLVLLFLRSL